MLNLKNRAEKRIHELLQNKLHLFDGVFGASDDVLGILSDGIDFEREVLNIVQKCRSAEEADREFDELTDRIKESIDADIEAARVKVLENLDADVVANLHRRQEDIATIVPEYERRLLMVVHGECPEAQFPEPGAQTFDLDGLRWTTRWKDADAEDWQFLRVNDGLGEQIVTNAKRRDHSGQIEALTFDPLANPYAGKLSGVADLAGKSGWLRVIRATMPIADAPREELIVVAETDDGEPIAQEIGDRMLMSPAKAMGAPVDHPREIELSALVDSAFAEFSKRVKEENYQWLLEEDERLNRYANDLEIETQAKIAALDEEIRELDRAKLSPHLSMEEKIGLMREAREKQGKRDDLVFNQHEAKKSVRKQVDDKLNAMAELLREEPIMETLFTLRWSVEPGSMSDPIAEAA